MLRKSLGNLFLAKQYLTDYGDHLSIYATDFRAGADDAAVPGLGYFLGGKTWEMFQKEI